MTSIATKLLAEKQELLERLEQNPGPNEREEIEQFLAKTNTALNLLDEAGPGETARAAGGTRMTNQRSQPR